MYGTAELPPSGTHAALDPRHTSSSRFSLLDRLRITYSWPLAVTFQCLKQVISIIVNFWWRSRANSYTCFYSFVLYIQLHNFITLHIPFTIISTISEQFHYKYTFTTIITARIILIGIQYETYPTKCKVTCCHFIIEKPESFSTVITISWNKSTACVTFS